MMDWKLDSEGVVLRALAMSLKEAYENLQVLGNIIAERPEVWPEAAKFFVKASELVAVSRVLADMLERKHEEVEYAEEIIEEVFEEFVEEDVEDENEGWGS
jgi:hypothetical protein